MPKKTSAGTESIVFRGIEYRRGKGGRYYKVWRWNKKTDNWWSDSLHRAIWRSVHGKIPKGHDIHHRDGDWDNNDIGNLECLSRQEHNKRHGTFVEWNKTDAAKEHHKRIGAFWTKTAKYRTFTCLRCGDEFESRHLDPERIKFCSKRCSTHHRINAKVKTCIVCETVFVGRPGSPCCSVECADKERNVNCVVCGKSFEKKMRKQESCSRACGRVRCWQKRRAGIRSNGEGRP